METLIFISYRRDTGGDYAKHLKKGLKREGISAFLDITDIPTEFKKTEKWWKIRDRAILDSDIFLLIITDRIETSREVRNEIALARRVKDMRFSYFRQQNLEPNIIINLKGEKLNLGDFNQITFETKEDLFRKFLRKIGKTSPKPISISKEKEDEVKALLSVVKNLLRTRNSRELALKRLCKMKAVEALKEIFRDPFLNNEHRLIALKIISRAEGTEEFLYKIARSSWHSKEFREIAMDSLIQSKALKHLSMLMDDPWVADWIKEKISKSLKSF